MFMQPQITVKMDWWEIDGHQGTFFYPADDLSKEEAEHDYDPDGEGLWESEKVSGFGCRLSAPGYMDCTDWSVFDTVAACKENLVDMFCACDGGEPCEICEALELM